MIQVMPRKKVQKLVLEKANGKIYIYKPDIVLIYKYILSCLSFIIKVHWIKVRQETP